MKMHMGPPFFRAVCERVGERKGGGEQPELDGHSRSLYRPFSPGLRAPQSRSSSLCTARTSPSPKHRSHRLRQRRHETRPRQVPGCATRFCPGSRELVRKHSYFDIRTGPGPGVVHTRRSRHRSRRQLRRQHSINSRSLRRAAQTLSKEIRIQTVGAEHRRLNGAGECECYARSGGEVAVITLSWAEHLFSTALKMSIRGTA
jgi:hypothetical protein